MFEEREELKLLKDNVEKVIKGKKEFLDLLITTFLAGGHFLIEDIPGVGKSTIAEAIARSLHLAFHRVQFTSDLLPSDILGVMIFNIQKNEFEFKEGPIFTNILLADEINRTPSKTQSALLEAMNERQVTIEKETKPLPKPFMVIATQNPLDYAGTYPLPEGQLDRFMMCSKLGLPDRETEKRILKEKKFDFSVKDLKPMLKKEEIFSYQKEIKEVFIKDEMLNYLLDIVEATRYRDNISLGITPRGSLDFLIAVKSYAYLKGRSFVIPEDIYILSEFVLPHRLTLRGIPYATLDEKKSVFKSVLERVRIPH